MASQDILALRSQIYATLYLIEIKNNKRRKLQPHKIAHKMCEIESLENIWVPTK